MPDVPSHDARAEDAARESVRSDVGPLVFDRIERFVAACRDWGRVTNLVGAADRDRLWDRHVRDSLQLVPLATGRGVDWIDLGSGGGFPGMVVAIAREGTRMTLVESNRKKAAFLLQAAGLCGATVVVEPRRIEDVPARAADVVSARALAPLNGLLTLSGKFFGSGTLGLFPKGRDAEAEVAMARQSHEFTVHASPSVTDREAAILAVTDLRPGA